MKASAGLLIYRRAASRLEVLLVHPGGPFWARKDLGAWSIPKGEMAPGEEALAAALREFQEETGLEAQGPFIAIGKARQSGGKTVYAFACEGDFDASRIRSNSFELEWPPGSGQIRSFPEVDRAQWFALPVARRKINKSQITFVDALERAAASVATSKHG